MIRNVLNRLSIPMAGEAVWLTTTYAAQQVLRLASNIALAWLLAPQLLGLMVLINSLRTAGELLTDLGIGQSVIQNPEGAEEHFYNTAWTIGIIRGFLIFSLALISSSALADIYGEERLGLIIPVAASIFIVSGFVSPGRYILMKRMNVRRLVLFDLLVGVTGIVLQIFLVLISPTIWALIIGLVLSTAVSTIGSYFLIPGLRHRITVAIAPAKKIVKFGKWMFISSIVYFLAMNFDRLYFADAIPFALLGVYGIARTYADTGIQFFQRVGGYILFPKISESAAQDANLRAKLTKHRVLLLASIAIPLAIGVSLADIFITIVYDDRYRQAGLFLSIFLMGAWFATLAVISDAIFMGAGKPYAVATSNLIKLVTIVIFVPIALSRFGVIAAIGVLVAADFVRYTSLTILQIREKIAFIGQDIFGTIGFVMLCLTFRALTGVIGLTSGLEGWRAFMP